MENKDWKIYTKTGDKGFTGLIGGARVPKYHQRIEAYGTIDELNSYIGLIRDLINDQDISAQLLSIESKLFVAESELATDPDAPMDKTLPMLTKNDITALENAIDIMTDQLPPLHSFILPGGHPTSSHCHIARCVCRRAERITIHLSVDFPVNELVIMYLNRLSDYLFVLARYVLFKNRIPETPWIAVR
jgi:cob(I)alamin adenosyltransferase